MHQYIGDQPEVTALKPDPEQLSTLHRKREHIGKILERLNQYNQSSPKYKSNYSAIDLKDVFGGILYVTSAHVHQTLRSQRLSPFGN